MTKSVKRLSKKQALALPLAVRGKSKSEIARTVGVTRQTITNWYKKPEFVFAVEKLQTELVNKMNDQAIARMDLAFSALEAILNDPDASPGEQFRAANSLLRAGNNALQSHYFAKRLSSLEDHVAAVKRAGFK